MPPAMDYVTFHEQPEGQLEYLVMAFAGWADAGESATNTVKYLQRKLGARKFAEIDPEEFFDFTQTRPYSVRTKEGTRRVHWPANEFTWSAIPGAGKGVMFFLGVEPNLRWRTFSRTVAALASSCGVKTVVHLGALLDAIPHTREVRLTGSATQPALKGLLAGSNIRASSSYQGPTGISSAVLEACAGLGIEYSSLWGHTPHYLQAAPNYRVSYKMTQTLANLLDLPLDSHDLADAAATFDQEVAQAIAKDDQISSYVSKLEAQYDEGAADSVIPDPAEVVQDLERFLRSQRRRRPGDP